MADIKIYFSVCGDSLDPIAFDTLVPIRNSDFWNKGDPIKNRLSTSRKESGWECSMEMSNVNHLEDISDIFFKQFIESSSLIGQYIVENNLEAKVSIVVTILNKEAPSMFLSQNLVNFLASIKCAIDIDLYVI
mgnify:CR=1 FL=1